MSNAYYAAYCARGFGRTYVSQGHTYTAWAWLAERGDTVRLRPAR